MRDDFLIFSTESPEIAFLSWFLERRGFRLIPSFVYNPHCAGVTSIPEQWSGSQGSRSSGGRYLYRDWRLPSVLLRLVL